MDKCRKCVKTFFLFVRICLLSFSLKPFLVILWPTSIEAISLFAYANFGDLASIRLFYFKVEPNVQFVTKMQSTIKKHDSKCYSGMLQLVAFL